MSELRDDTLLLIAEILWGQSDNRADEIIEEYLPLARAILSIPELAIVDRKAGMPCVEEDNPFIRLDEQANILEAGWVKEVKE